MFRKYILPIIALAGVAFAIFTVVRGDKPVPYAPPVTEAPHSPYSISVAGSGIVEASTGNMSLGTNIAGIVSKIFVQVGSEVKAGAPLFAIDDRAIRAEIDTLQTAVRIAEIQLAEAEYDLALMKPLAAIGATPKDVFEKNRFAAQKAKAQLAQAQAKLVSSQTDLERLTVRAPVDGEVLQLKTHLGEFAQADATATGYSPLLLFGSVEPLHVRVDIDEYDAWRVRAGAAAVGFLRGNKAIRMPLTFVRFEPYVVPKKSLTGDSTERVDTRVLQVIFRFVRGEQPIFVGQQMDVFIDATAGSQDHSNTPQGGKNTSSTP